jgi:hypothetical protein
VNNRIRVSTCVGSYDLCHPNEKQTRVRIEHPALPTGHLTFSFEEDWEERFEDLDWESLVTRAVDDYAKSTWSDRKYAKDFQAQMEADPTIGDSFYKEWAVRRLSYIKETVDKLSKERENIENTLEDL